MTAPQSGPLVIGTHRVELDPPDVFVIRLVSDVSQSDVAAILDAFEQFATAVPRAYQLIDVSRVGHISPEARRLAGIRQLPPSYAGLVVFGGNFQQQLVAKLATTAGWLLRGRALGKPMPECLRDEIAARAWISARRAAH